MGVLAGCDARRLARRMAIPCKRQATPQRARQHSQNIQVIHLQALILFFQSHPFKWLRRRTMAWLCNWHTRDSLTPSTAPISRRFSSSS